MHNRRAVATLAAAIAVAAVALFVGSPSLAQAPEKKETAGNPVVARGKYLVEQVAMCADCHTPRGADGAPDQNQWLRGAILDFSPKHPVPGWVPMAPRLAGLRPGWTPDDMAKFLESGKKPDGTMAHPPMPMYRFQHDDAVAATAYMQSLAEGK